MKSALIAIAVFSALSGAAIAQESQSSSKQVSEKRVVPLAVREHVRRDTGHNRAVQGVALRKATVADIDLNGDGHVSFEELFRFDVKQDF